MDGGGEWIPQSRNRLFLVGHLRGRSIRKIFPIIDKNDGFCKKSNEIKIVGSTKGEHQTSHGQRNIVYSEDGLIGALTATDYKQPKMVLRQLVGGKQGQRVYDPSGTSVTLSSQGGGQGAKTGLYYIDGRVRRLTPRECWRLQGFPDELFDKAKNAGLSNTQLYKQAGNSVMVNVIYEIGKRLTSNEK